MDPEQTDLSPADYRELLNGYLRSRSESDLYQASRLSQTCIESGLGPEDIVALHFEALDRILADTSYRIRARANLEAQEFLLEVMIAYGVKYKEYLELRLAEDLRDAEARTRRERERALEAERLRSERDELLGVIAHELRSPLTAAQGNIDLATRRLSQGEVESASRLLTQAREALGRLSRLTGDLVEASRGELPAMERSPQDLGTIIAQAYAWAHPAAASKGISLVFDAGQAPVYVLANADALLSLVGNLVSNAIRYTLGGGTVTIRHGAAAGSAWIEVQDTGIGMAPEERQRIFERFYRSPAAKLAEPKGLGLGLALVQKVVEAHQGRIEVESESGKGSTFRIYLPNPETPSGEGVSR